MIMLKKINIFFYLLFQSVLNPNKFFSVLKKKLFRIPELKSLDRINNRYLKEFYYFFWTNLAKKNNRLRKLFFENQNLQSKIYFDYNNVDFKSNFLNSLAKYGIVCVNNILPENENIKIQNDFYELQNYVHQKNKLSNWLVEPVKTVTETKFRIYSKKKLSNYPNLNIVSNFISQEITGRPLRSEAEFYFDNCFKLPDKKILGDNVLHVDRYLPNFKIIYSPFDVDEDSAPFMYLPQSHKINKNYKDMIFSKAYQDIEISTYKKFKNKVIKLSIKKNSLIIFLANGFHGRSPFSGLKNRMFVFLQYNNSFNKLSLLNYKNFNLYKKS